MHAQHLGSAKPSLPSALARSLFRLQRGERRLGLRSGLPRLVKRLPPRRCGLRSAAFATRCRRCHRCRRCCRLLSLGAEPLHLRSSTCEALDGLAERTLRLAPLRSHLGCDLGQDTLV